jgi:putative flippase GtrA
MGFTVNLIILLLLTKLTDIHIVLAQLIGAEIALGGNFILHNQWTYKTHKVKKSLRSLVIQFHAMAWPAIIGSTAMVSLGVNVFHSSKILALVVSSFVTLLWNFVWSKFVVWRDVSKQEIEEFAG